MPRIARILLEKDVLRILAKKMEGKFRVKDIKRRRKPGKEEGKKQNRPLSCNN